MTPIFPLALFCVASLTPGPALQTIPQGLRPLHTAGPVEPQKQHGRVKWFEGSYAALLATAKREERVILLNFYTDLCSYCRVLDSEAYSDARVVKALAPTLCFSINAETETGRKLNAIFPTEDHYPALIFLDPDGKLRDRILGYLPTGRLLPEVERILGDKATLGDLRQKVAEQPRNIDAIWDLARKLKQLGDLAAYEAEIGRIRILDPEGTSQPIHSLAIQAAISVLKQTGDDQPLRQILLTETYPRLLFEGWNKIAFDELMRAKKAGMQNLNEEASQYKISYHRSHLKAWDFCPKELAADFGNHVAWELYLDWHKLDRPMRQEAIIVARATAKVAPTSSEVLDTLACILFSDGQVGEAIQVMRKCVKLEPDRELWKKRLEMFKLEEL